MLACKVFLCFGRGEGLPAVVKLLQKLLTLLQELQGKFHIYDISYFFALEKKNLNFYFQQTWGGLVLHQDTIFKIIHVATFNLY